MLVACLLFQVAGAATGLPQAPRAPARSGRPPRIELEAPPAFVRPGDVLRLTVTARDPERGRVSLHLCNPPPGAVFDPLVLVPSPASAELRWTVPTTGGSQALRRLVFETRDAGGALARQTLELEVHPREAQTTPFELVDVTGDGLLDVVAVASSADVGGIINAGAVYVWAGARAPTGAPTASLRVAGPDRTSVALGRALELADVSGDGIVDVVASGVVVDPVTSSGDGALFVWAGGPGLAGKPAPTAILVNVDGSWHGLTPRTLDVDGDGIRDVVASEEYGLGTILAWKGGAGLVGVPAPLARLSPNDRFGAFSLIDYADVSGDGIADLIGRHVLGTTSWEDAELLVWFGGSDFAESDAPDTILRGIAAEGGSASSSR